MIRNILFSLYFLFPLIVVANVGEEIDIPLDNLSVGEREINQVEEDSDDAMIEAPPKALPEELLVEQEYLAIGTSKNLIDVIPSYKERRSTWGFLIGLSYSLYSPTNYEPNFASNFTFDGLYGEGTSSGLLEATFLAKWNIPLGALAFGLGAGYYKVCLLYTSPSPRDPE